MNTPGRADLLGVVFESALSNVNIRFFSAGKKTGSQAVSGICTPLEQRGPGGAVRGPGGPLFFGQVLHIIAIEHTPQRGAEYPFCIQDRETERVGIHKLVGHLIYSDLTANAPGDNKPGNEGAADNKEVLGQAAEGYVHILKGLGEHIDGNAIVTVIFKKLDSGFRERFIVSVIELYASLIYNEFAVLDEMYAQVLLSTDTESAGDGDIGPDGIGAFPVLAVQYPVSETTGKAAAEPQDLRFPLGLPGQIGSIGGLAGAGDTEIDVELEPMFWMTCLV